MSTRTTFSRYLATTAIVVVSFLGGEIFAARVIQSGRDNAFGMTTPSVGQTPIKRVRQAYSLIKAKYVEDIRDEDKLMDGAIAGMVDSLHGDPYNDPFSDYLPAQEYRSLRAETTGTYAGVGVLIEVDYRSGYPVIAKVFKGSPAEEVGILAGDLIVGVDDKPTANLALDAVVKLIQGKSGTKLKMTVEREGTARSLDFTMTRRQIKIESVDEAKMLKPGVGYIRVTTFNSETADDFDKALLALQKQGVKGLVIDLRNNTGGVLSAAIDMCRPLLSNKTVVSMWGLHTKRVQYTVPDNRRDEHFDGPVVLLVNGMSASASEVVAGALRDNKRAVLVGEKTFGKGVVQEIEELPGAKTALLLTIAKYYTPSGVNIHHKGIEPDVTVSFKDYETQVKEVKDLESEIKDAQNKVLDLRKQLTNAVEAHDLQLDRAVGILQKKVQ